jgi:hypothetical protein
VISVPREASRRLAVELVGRLPLLTQEKGKVRLCDYRDRGAGSTLGRPPEGADAAPLIDVLHRALWLAEERPLELRDFVAASGDITGTCGSRSG